MRTLVEDLQSRVLKAQLNVDTIHKLINTWSLMPLFERKNGKKKNLIFLDDHDERVFKRWVFFIQRKLSSFLDELCMQAYPNLHGTNVSVKHCTTEK